MTGVSLSQAADAQAAGVNLVCVLRLIVLTVAGSRKAAT